jgi:hypothetical protein
MEGIRILKDCNNRYIYRDGGDVLDIVHSKGKPFVIAISTQSKITGRTMIFSGTLPELLNKLEEHNGK